MCLPELQAVYDPLVGVTKPISSIPFVSYFSAVSKHTLAIEYHVYIWQVSLQLSCGGTCHINVLQVINEVVLQDPKFGSTEVKEQNFSTPTSRQSCLLNKS